MVFADNNPFCLCGSCQGDVILPKAQQWIRVNTNRHTTLFTPQNKNLILPLQVQINVESLIKFYSNSTSTFQICSSVCVPVAFINENKLQPYEKRACLYFFPLFCRVVQNTLCWMAKWTWEEAEAILYWTENVSNKKKKKIWFPAERCVDCLKCH